MRSRYPPPPCVEEEPVSLARELDGLSNLDDKVSPEVICARGSVDQYPILVDSALPGSSDRPVMSNNMPETGPRSSNQLNTQTASCRREPVANPRPRPASQTNSRVGSSISPASGFVSAASSREREHSVQPRYSQPAPEVVPPRPVRPRSPARGDGLPLHGRGRSSSEAVLPGSMHEPRNDYWPRPGLAMREEDRRGRERSTQEPSSGFRHEPKNRHQSRPPSPTRGGRTGSPTKINGLVKAAEAHQQQSSYHLAGSRAPRSSSRPPQQPTYSGKEDVPVHIIPHASYGMRTARSRSRGPGYERMPGGPVQPLAAHSGGSNEHSQTLSPRLLQRPDRQESPPGYQSDTITARPRPTSYALPSIESRSSTAGHTANARTLAERIEEKLRQRQELRESVSLSDSESRLPKELNHVNTRLNPSVSASAPHSPSRELQRNLSHRPRGDSTAATSGRTSAPTIVAQAAPALTRSKSTNRGHSRSVSSDNFRPSRAATTVKFHDHPTQSPSPSRGPVLKPTNLAQRPVNPSGLCITLCPRSVAMAGYNDWYTLKGLTHLDICPSCMKQIGHSRFRDSFIPSLARPSSQKIRCAFSNPWVRLAWTQMIKQQHESLEMLYQMTRPPPGTRPCSGRAASEQSWYRIVNPETGSYLPSFHVCGSCARNVRVLMPAHRDTFQLCPEPQERACDLVTSSPRFVKYIDLLDDASSRADSDPSRRPDPREFLAYAKRKVVLRDCLRDRPVLGSWHYMTELPELSICEDCYDEVVWPLAKAHHPLARSISSSMRYLPGDGPNLCREATCQLYSGRMRARFRDAVIKDDFPGLRDFALRRFEAERRFRDRREELFAAEEKGYDCDVEMNKAIEEWRRWE
ncbi:Uncharacterized protein PECH_006509 [Penicillium ucsense]|uniref:Uncharacterized protein n=1 Tax=Penicillium ucsense TaxID=2839758 RepID=A0A8J8W1F3_9EURO|nr:Uncharacterized protein PECM_006741 [Penicillium ucsense]KAF7735606.1 Uncharacterized protein PECH_006509 [Penicillium ucsense]